jgi:transcriptional regulator with XRE-family HTH domain
MEEKTINERIRILIENLGLSREQFATAVGISRGGIYKIVENEVTPRLATIHSILAAFPTVSKAWLLYGQGEMIGEAVESNPQSSTFVSTLLQKLEAEINKKDQEIQWLRDLVSKMAPLGKLKASTFSLNSMKLKTAA